VTQAMLLRRSRQDLGAGRLLLSAKAMLVRACPRYDTYYIYENTLDGPEIALHAEDVTLKVVEDPGGFDMMVSEGRGFSHWNPCDLRRKAVQGAVAVCLFVGQDLAHITWLAFEERARAAVDPFPLKLDWHTEAWIGSTHTAVRYRGMGLYSYAYGQVFRLLAARGLVKGRFTVQKTNSQPQRVQGRLGSIIVGDGSCVKIAWWRYYGVKGAGLRLL